MSTNYWFKNPLKKKYSRDTPVVPIPPDLTHSTLASAILRLDALVFLRFASSMFLLGRLTVPVQQRLTGVLFYPPLNLILCHTNSVLHIFDGSSCRFLRSVVLSNTSEKLSLCYLGNSGCLVVTCGTTFNARSHYADVILLDDILCGSIETPEQNTTLSFRNDQLPGLSAMLVTEENKPTLKGSCLNVERCEVDFHRDSKFNTVSIQGAFSKLVSWFQVFSEHHVLAGVPLPTLTPCLNYRLLRLCTSDVEAMSMAYWRTSLMNVEGFRRLTFANWPHMEYRWATPEAMAAAGFYCPQGRSDDYVTCFACNACLLNWEPADEPWSEHSRHAGSCPLLRSLPSGNVTIAESRASEPACRQMISTSPIEVIGSSMSTDFLPTSTRHGDITIWDVTIFNRRALEFRLIDLLMETCSASIAPDDVEVHSAYLLTSKCDSLSSIQPTFKLPSGNAVPHPPAKHHLIIGCRVATFVVKSMQERGAIFVKSVGRFDSASLCLLVVQLYPLNSLGVMWAQDANPSMDYQHVMNESAVNKLTGILADDSPFMQQRSLSVNYSEDAGEMMVKPTTVYTTASDIQHSDDDANDLFPSVETVQTDRSEPMYEVSNDVSDADSPLIEAAMHEPLSLLAFARVARQHATGFSRALGLDDITFDLVQRHENNKLSQTSLTSCIGSSAAESKKLPTSNTSKFSSELCDAPHLAHSSTLPNGSQTDNFKPKLIELIELPTQSGDMFLDVIQLSLISTTFEPNETENYFTPYSSNILVCCGRSQSSAPVDNIYHHSASVGGLYLFGYDPLDPSSQLPVNPLPNHIVELSGDECPLQMRVIQASNSASPSDSEEVMEKVFLRSSEASPSLIFTEDINRGTSGTESVMYVRCLILTCSGSVLQLDMEFNQAGCCSHRLASVLPNCSGSSHVVRICMDYCSVTNSVCIGDSSGSVMVYRLDSCEMGDSVSQESTIFPNASSKSKAGDSPADYLFAYSNNPLQHLHTLTRLITTRPLETRVRVCFDVPIGWIEVDLDSASTHTHQTEINHLIANKTVSRRKFSVFSPFQNSSHTLCPEPARHATPTSSTADSDETANVISRFVMLHLLTCSTLSNATDPDNPSVGYPTYLKALSCAGLSVELSLTGGSSARLWEYSPKQAAIKNILSNNTSLLQSASLKAIQPSPPSSCSNVSLDFTMNVSLPHAVPISHFSLHLLPAVTEPSTLPPIYITLLRSNLSPADSASGDCAPPLHHAPFRDSEEDLVIQDLQAPFIDEDIHIAHTTHSEPLNRSPIWSNDSPFQIPGRSRHFPHGHPIPPCRLRQLNGTIVAGPYLFSEFLNSATNNEPVLITLTSPDLITSRARLFVVHFRIFSEAQSSSGATASQSLSDWFVQIGLTVHRFSQISSTKFAPKYCAVARERMQLLAVLRSADFHSALIDSLAMDTEAHFTSDRPDVHQRSSTPYASLLLLNWILHMYHQESDLTNDILPRLFTKAAKRCDALVNCLLVHADRPLVQLGTAFIFGLIHLECLWRSATSNLCLPTPFQTRLWEYFCSPWNSDYVMFIRCLLTARCSAGVDALFSLLLCLCTLVRRSDRGLDSHTSRLLATILRTIQLLHFRYLSQSKNLSLQQLAKATECLQSRYGLFGYDFGDPALFEIQTAPWSPLGLNAASSHNIFLASILDISTRNLSSSNASGFSYSPVNPDFVDSDDVSESASQNQSSQLNNGTAQDDTPQCATVAAPHSILPPEYAVFISGGSAKSAINTGHSKPCVSFVETSSSNSDTPLTAAKTPSLFPPFPVESNYEAFFSDLLCLARVPAIHESFTWAGNQILPGLHDWQTRGLLSVEPLRVAVHNSAIQTFPDCHLERSNLFTGLPVGPEGLFASSVSETGRAVDGLNDQLSFSPEAYHLVISRMHPGAHRSVTLSFQSMHTGHDVVSAPTHCLTDVFVPVNPYLACMTIEALLDRPRSCKKNPTKLQPQVRLVAISTLISRNPLIIRDLNPPVLFHRLRITVAAGLDCPLSCSRVHLGAFFGHSFMVPHAIEFTPSARPTTAVHSSLADLSSCLSTRLDCICSCLASTQSELLHLLAEDNSDVPNQHYSRPIDRDLEKRVLFLYNHCWDLRYQYNWILQAIQRVMYFVSGVPTKSIREPISAVSITSALSSDHLRYLIENCLLFLVNGINGLSCLDNFPTVSSDRAPCADGNFPDTIYQLATDLLETTIIHGTRPMQVLTIGLVPNLLRLCYSAYSIVPELEPPLPDKWFFNFLRIFTKASLDETSAQIPIATRIDTHRRVLAFWLLVQHFIRVGQISRLIVNCLYILEGGTNGYNFTRDSFSAVLLLLDVLFDWYLHQNDAPSPNSMNKLTSALDTRLSAQSPFLGRSGLLRWYYLQLLGAETREPAPYSLTPTPGSQPVTPAGRYEYSRAVFYRWHVHRLSQHLKTFTSDRRKRYEMISSDSFPLGALFIERTMESRLLTLMRRCIPCIIPECGSTPSPMLGLSVPRPLDPILSADPGTSDSSIVCESTVRPKVLIDSQLKVSVFSNLFECAVKHVPSGTYHQTEELHSPQDFLLVCRLAGRLLTTMTADEVRLAVNLPEDVRNSSLYLLFEHFCGHTNVPESQQIFMDLTLQGLTLMLSTEHRAYLSNDASSMSQSAGTAQAEFADLPLTIASAEQKWLYYSSIWRGVSSHMLRCAVRSLLQHRFSDSTRTDHLFANPSTGPNALRDLASECFNNLLLRAQFDASSEENCPSMLKLQLLYLALVGEASFEPWAGPSPGCCVSPHRKSITVHVAGLQRMLTLLITHLNLLDEPLCSPSTSKHTGLAALALRFISSTVGTSQEVAHLLLTSAEFSILFDAILSGTLGNFDDGAASITRAVEVMFTWFAFLPSDSSCVVHPFDEFCVNRLLAWLSAFSNSTHCIDNRSSNPGPLDIQAVLLTSLCQRIQGSTGTEQLLSSLGAANDRFIICSEHTIHRLPLSLRVHISMTLLMHLHHTLRFHLKHNKQRICFSCRSTLFDADFQALQSKLSLWSPDVSEVYTAETEVDNVEVTTSSDFSLSRLVCCLYQGRCSDPSIYPHIQTDRDYQSCLLSQLLHWFCLGVLQSPEYSPDTYPHFAQRFIELLVELSHGTSVSPDVCRLVTLSCLIGGWSTLRRFSSQLLTGLYATSIADWLLFSLYTVANQHALAFRDKFKQFLSLSEGFSCPLLMLFACCNHGLDDNDVSFVRLAINAFLCHSTDSGLPPMNSLSQLLGRCIVSTTLDMSSLNTSELGQAIITHSLRSGDTNIHNVPWALTHVLPAGLSAPIAVFGRASIDYWHNALKLPSSPPVSVSTLRSSLNICDSHSLSSCSPLVDFAPFARVYSDAFEGDISSLIMSMSAQDHTECSTFPLYLGSLNRDITPDKENKFAADDSSPVLNQIRPILQSLDDGSRAVNLTFRFPFLIWLTRIEWNSKDSDKGQEFTAELYRDIPGTSRSYLVATHSCNSHQLFRRVKQPICKGDASNACEHFLIFKPQLISHLVLRLHGPEVSRKSSSITRLRLLGHHVEAVDLRGNHEMLSEPLSDSLPNPDRITSSLALLHVIHNELMVHDLPPDLISKSLVHRLCTCVVWSSLSTNHSAEVNHLRHMASCHREFRDLVSELSNVVTEMNNSSDCSESLSDWLYTCSGIEPQSPVTDWRLTPYSTVLAERILVFMTEGRTRWNNSLAFYLLGMLLRDRRYTELPLDLHSNDDITDASIQPPIGPSVYHPLSPIASVGSTVSQRLFTWLCLHSDSGQGKRLRMVIDWLQSVCDSSDGVVDECSRPLPVTYTAQLLLTLSGVFWRLNDMQRSLCLTDHLVTSVSTAYMHLARCLADTGSSPSMRQRMELEYLRDALEGLLCAICAMNPPIALGLISRFVDSHFPSDESLDVVAAVMRSEGVIDTIFESTENPLFECCSHLTRCLHAETMQNQQNEAIRYMRLFARLMDVNQPTSLRIHVGALVCDKILPRLFDLFAPPLHHIQPYPSSFTSHYSSSLSLWNVRRVAVELCRTLMIPLEWPSEQCSPTMYQTCLAHLLSDTLKNSITRNDFILPEFIQSLLLEASKPVVGTRTISVFAIPTDYSDDSLATVLTGPPVSPSHVPPIDSLSPSGLCAWIRGCARDLQFNYHIHPSHIPAFLSLQCCETPRQDAHLSVMHIRLLICSLLFPFVSIPLESSYRTLITELPALRGFELALARTSFVIGRSVTAKVWNDAYHLPIGAESDLWDMRQLTQSLFPDSQTGFESLCFLVRSCPHPQVPSSPALQSKIFNLHQCSTDCRPAFSSVLSETDVLRFLAKFIVQHTVMHSFSMSTCSSQNTTPELTTESSSNIKFECCSVEQASCSPAELEQPPPVGSEPLCGWGEFLMRSLKSTVSASIFTPPFSSSIVFPKSQRTAFAHFGPSDAGWDCTVAQPAPLHHLLPTALFLCLPGYSECLTAINVPAPPGSRELVSQCVRRLENSLLLRDLVQYELRTIHSPLMYQPSGVEELAELTSLGSPPNLLTFALDALCSYYLKFRSNSPHHAEVATIGFEHLSTGVLDLILALLDCISHSSSQELRSSTQTTTLDFAPDATVSRSNSTRRHHRLIHLARVDFKRQLSALTAGATEKSASTKSTTESAARSAESTSSVWAKGTGFCTGSCTSAWDTETLNRKVLIEDSYAIMFFNVLAAFLWAFAVDGPKRLVRHISLHLSQSSLLSLIASYLRNDSALDLAMRVPLYRTIFRFLRVVAHCPPMYWIFTTTDQAVRQVESLLTQSSCLSDHWYAKSSSTWFEHLSHPMDESLPDGLDHSCPIRLLRDLQNFLITYERHFKKLDFPCGESPPLSTGPQIPVSAGSHVRDISVGKRKTGLTRQHSVRCRNPRGQTKSENFGVKLLDKMPIKAKASLSGTMEVSTNEPETETLTASTPLDPEVNAFDLLQWKRQSTPVGLLQLSCGPIDIRRNGSQLVSPAHDDPLNCSESVVENHETLGDSSGTTIPHQETHLNRLEHLKPIRGKTDDHTAKHALSDNDPSAEPNHCAPCLTEYSDKWTPLTQPSSSHQTRKTPPPGDDLHLLIDELRITFSMARLLVRLMEQVVLPSSGNTTVHAHDRISQPDPTSSTVLTSGSCRNHQMYFERLHPFQFGMIKMVSDPVNCHVRQLVRHHFIEHFVNNEGLILDNDYPLTGRNAQLRAQDGAIAIPAVTHAPSARTRAGRLAQELVTLSTGLPLTEQSSIFVRADENNACLLKALITGPSETPYANGCFVFDILIPPQYPSSPPMFHLETTGNNTVRFNPNLYEDGTVCLSILNTWHGRPEERWNQKTSTLLQVLISIQSFVFVSQPYFNEPGFECSYNTPWGKLESQHYNAKIRTHTLRWAVLNHLRHPVTGFEEVIFHHFQLRREDLLSQLECWLSDMDDLTESSFRSWNKRFRDDFEALKVELALLDEGYAAWLDRTRSGC